MIVNGHRRGVRSQESGVQEEEERRIVYYQ
jgi:hypothetical protein